MPRVFLGAESLRAGNGGIARLARLAARALAHEAATSGWEVGGTVLADREPNNDLSLRHSVADGSRFKFVSRIWRAALQHDLFVYDFLGVARAHRGLPTWLRRPFVAFLCGIEVWEGFIRPEKVAAAKRARMLLSISDYTRKRAERVDSIFGTAQVCWLGTESDEAPRPVDYSSRPPTVMILGRLDPSPWKGHHHLIKAWPKVVSAVPDARLLVVGTGRGLEAAQALALASSVAGQIEFRGFVKDADVELLWNQCSVFAMPGEMEGFGLVYVEAMQHGIPVIASKFDASAEINVDGETGFNVDRDHGDDLADALIRLLRDRALAASMGERGAARWREHFTFTAFRKRFINFLSSIGRDGGAAQ